MLMSVGLVGFVIFVLLAWVLGGAGGKVNGRVVVWGVLLQFVLGLAVFRSGVGRSLLMAVNDMINAMTAAAAAGPVFVFGALADANASSKAGIGFILFFQGLLSIIVFSALLQVLYQIGLMGWLVKQFARVFTRMMRISGVESLAATSNVFVGNEAIITVRPFLDRMTRSELCVLMTACMATVSANMMGVYVAILGRTFPGIAGHIASASLISAPAALLAAKLILPETAQPETLGRTIEPHVEKSPNVVTAVMAGADAGGKLLLGVTLMLIAVLGLLGIIDLGLNLLGGVVNPLAGWRAEWSVSGLLAMAFRPAAWLMGVPWHECGMVGELLGLRVTASEVGAYARLAELLAANALSPRSAVIASYGLCGFAHIPAIAITVGGIAALSPGRRNELATIAPRAFVAATLACLMTGCVAGIFAGDAGTVLLGAAR